MSDGKRPDESSDSFTEDQNTSGASKKTFYSSAVSDDEIAADLLQKWRESLPKNV